MKKSNIIIITLISTIFSLAFILMSYFGLSRYISMYISPTKKFINNYSHLPKSTEDKVVISLSTTKGQIHKLKPLFNSLMDQTVKVDQIALVFSDTKNETIIFPEYITDIANVFVIYKDYGEGNKLLPSLLREKDCGTIIISLDNNKVYGKDFIETILEESKNNPETLITDKKMSLMLVKPEFFDYDVINREKSYFDNEWFIEKAKKSKIMEYNENYKIL